MCIGDIQPQKYKKDRTKTVPGPIISAVHAMKLRLFPQLSIHRDSLFSCAAKRYPKVAIAHLKLKKKQKKNEKQKTDLHRCHCEK